MSGSEVNLAYELLNIGPTAEYRRIDEYSFGIYNTCSIGACACRVIVDQLLP